MRSSDTRLATADVAINSCKNAISSSIFSVSNLAKFRRPPGKGGGTLDLRKLGCEVTEFEPLALRDLAGGGTDAAWVDESTPGVRAPLTTGRRDSGGDGSKKAWE